MRAFTLIEVLLVLGLASVLGSAACLASYDSYARSLKVNLKENVRASLVRARTEAMASAVGQDLSLGTTSVIFSAGAGTTSAAYVEAGGSSVRVYATGAVGD